MFTIKSKILNGIKYEKIPYLTILNFKINFRMK